MSGWVDQGVRHCFSTRLRKLQTRALPACFGIQDSKLLAAHQSVLSCTESDAALCVVKQNNFFVIAPRLEAVSSSETQPFRRRKKSSSLFGFVFFPPRGSVADAMLNGRLAQQQRQCRAHVSVYTGVHVPCSDAQGRRHITQVASVTERTRHTNTAPVMQASAARLRCPRKHATVTFVQADVHGSRCDRANGRIL